MTFSVLAAATLCACGELDDAEEARVETTASALTQSQRETLINNKFNQNVSLLVSPINSASNLGNGAKRDYAGASNNSSIYVGDTVNSAHIILGFIRSKYLAKNAQAGVLGYPTTDELTTAFGTGKYNFFQTGGRILWKNGAGSAFEVHGAIDGLYTQLGLEWANLGFPTSDQVAVSGKQKNDFEFGKIYLESSTAWPVLLSFNSSSKLSDMNWPRISGSITPSSAITGDGCISASGTSFPAGATVSLATTSFSGGINTTARKTAVVAGNGTFSISSSCGTGIRTVGGVATIWARVSTGGTSAVTSAFFSNGIQNAAP